MDSYFPVAANRAMQERESARKHLQSSLAEVLGELSLDLGPLGPGAGSGALVSNNDLNRISQGYGFLSNTSTNTDSNRFLLEQKILEQSRKAESLAAALKSSQQQHQAYLSSSTLGFNLSHHDLPSKSLYGGPPLTANSILAQTLPKKMPQNQQQLSLSHVLSKASSTAQGQVSSINLGATTSLMDTVRSNLIRDYIAQQQKSKQVQDAYMQMLQQGKVQQHQQLMSGTGGATAAIIQAIKQEQAHQQQQEHEKQNASPPVMMSPSLQYQLMQRHRQAQQMSQPTHSVSTESLIKVENTSGINAKRVADAIGTQLRIGQPYIDVTSLPGLEETGVIAPRNRGGVTESFPEKLHRILNDASENSQSSIVSFLPHGRAFAVHNVEAFVEKILPDYFKQSKWNSFARQLNLYGFVRITSGRDAGAYYHELFLQGRPNLCLHMRRVGVPQQHCDRRKRKAKMVTETAPDFYSMSPVVASSSPISASPAKSSK